MLFLPKLASKWVNGLDEREEFNIEKDEDDELVQIIRELDRNRSKKVKTKSYKVIISKNK